MSFYADTEFREVHLFYSMFLTQMPIMHLGTFTVDGKPEILISAMQACGALYVKTQAAAMFIDETLASARDQLVSEFVSRLLCSSFAPCSLLGRRKPLPELKIKYTSS